MKIFTFGIQRGNITELKAMASEPKDEHCFLFDSFENIETFVTQKITNGL